MAYRLKMNDDLIDYVYEHGVRESETLQELRRYTAQIERGDMMIPPEEGQLLAFLVRLIGARSVLELGVFTGYSTLWMAEALPEDGRLIACEKLDTWEETAKSHWKKAGVDLLIDLRLGRANSILEKLLEDGEAGQFDMALIDADKKNYVAYYEAALKLLRPGGLLVFDNALRSGDVIDPVIDDPAVAEIRKLNKLLKSDPRVQVSMLPFSDGLTLALKAS